MAFQILCGAVVVLAFGMSARLGLPESGACFPPDPQNGAVLASAILALALLYDTPPDS
jgi:hypothetical protein